ncbi:large ribosomal subunit protein mL40 [Lepeophtheirus salmonis]|uniref:large ribosomal subunit protein mL40 n=1 Tax=Lepeophtheirus salmonis TaxID=72036 RepID=UPI001AE1BB05|nr:39S ribosomal protein L40, mitochondrial-like [Lepeophtheirus salmonis]
MLGVFIRGLSTTPSVGFRMTTPIAGAPMKRKAKQDPAIVRAKEEKRRRRLAKALRRMENQSRIVRPINELEDDSDKERTSRAIADAEETERRALLLKEWNRHCTRSYFRNMDNLNTILQSREEALEELKSISEPLYISTLSLDSGLTNIQWTGPPLTPPLGKEHLVDGKYTDITKEYQVHYDDMKVFMEQLVQKKRIRKKKDEEEDED